MSKDKGQVSSPDCIKICDSISSLVEHLESLAEKIGGLAATIGTLTEKTSALSEQVESLEDEINILDERNKVLINSIDETRVEFEYANRNRLSSNEWRQRNG